MMPPSWHNRRDGEQEIPIYPVHFIQDFIDLCLFPFCHLFFPAHSVIPRLETVPSFDQPLAALSRGLLQPYHTLWRQGA